ncbi:glucose-6-phosphate dehydrogenase [Podospora conica]|nr:glucose-6-phosphate dehydrogenase [Schizothecium conicum]
MASEPHGGTAIELKNNTVIVVLGASGDLAKKKTYRNGFLPNDIKIVGYARTKMDHEEYLRRIKSYIKTPTKDIEQQLEDFASLCTYVSGQYDRDESFMQLNKHLEELEQGRNETHRLFYMALPPSVFTIVSQHLKKCCYPSRGIARVIVEKPFGKDLASSRELQKSLEPDWKEDELFRIDHYLGKEMVKNILILRFGNSFLGATWNRHHIDNVQITFKEPFGTEGRGGYFDEFGIIRDVMQNHLLQVLTLLAMERPISFSSEDIRDEKVRVLRAIPAIEPKNVIIGQYGKSLDGSKPAYKEDDTVPKESRCPTFCALVAYIKNERWDGVPFIMKAGKALNEQKTEIRVQFKDVTSGIFKDIPRNELVMRIQPNESVYIKMNSKLPGLSMQTVVTELDLTYRRRFSDLKIPEAYESLILDCLKGDHSNFVRDDELDASWRIFTPLLHYLDDNKEIIPMEYPYGSRGPAVLDDFTASYGYKFSDAAGYQWPTTSALGPGNKFELDMEYGTQTGVRTNHDRDHWANGANGGGAPKKMYPDIGKGGFTDMTHDSLMAVDSEFQNGELADINYSAINDQPEEIPHISTDILPLNLILSRLAQYSHGRLEETITTLASKPIPPNSANGNGHYQSAGGEDASQESVEKKALLLSTLQDLHTRWVKALVIANWSKKAEGVSRLIDIRAHLASKLDEFSQTFFTMIHNKQELRWAKLPSPDLKTALQVLRAGEVSYMPELGYLDPPPVTPEEEARWMDNVNTTLSIPLPFRDYKIDSGRVTFRVAGEFELELTIGDEDFDSQYWFMDFRFLFRPAPAKLSEPLRAAFEHKVNEILAVDGLEGCHKYLHEFVLTQKITEFWRQAVESSKQNWINSLKVERLNRSMAIQYWVNRPHSQGTKCWIIMGVDSRTGPDGLPDPGMPSALTLRWFRDGKEVKDCDIPFDTDTISTDALLNTVVARHVEYVLESFFNKLSSKHRFGKGRARLELDISDEQPSDSYLKVQFLGHESIELHMDSLTGAFNLLPSSAPVYEWQQRLNTCANPVEEATTILERFRWMVTIRDLSSRTKSIGWTVSRRNPVNQDELRTMVQATTESRETFHSVWLRRAGYNPSWFVMMTMSLGGDNWWLVELYTPRIRTLTRLPMGPGEATLSDDFFQNLTLYVSGIMVQFTDQRELHHNRMMYATRLHDNAALPPQVKLPTHIVRLSDMIRDKPGSATGHSRPWAQELIPIIFKGIQPPTDEATPSPEMQVVQVRRDTRLKVIAEASITVTDVGNFQLLQRHIDEGVTFDAETGRFKLQLRADMGTPTVTLLAERIQALVRLVDFVEAIRRAGKGVVAQSVTLRDVVFTYSNTPAGASPQSSRAWKVWLDLSKDGGLDIKFEPGNPHLHIVDILRDAGSINFRAVPGYLQTTLPVFRAVGKIHENWDGIAARSQGIFRVLPKGLHWLTLYFEIGPGRSVELDLRFNHKAHLPVWQLQRAGVGADVGDAGRRLADEFDKVLGDRVWSAQGEGIRGLVWCAVAESEQGTENLLAMLDAAIQSLVGTPAPPPPPAPAPAPALPVGNGAASNGTPQAHAKPASSTARFPAAIAATAAPAGPSTADAAAAAAAATAATAATSSKDAAPAAAEAST